MHQTGEFEIEEKWLFALNSGLSHVFGKMAREPKKIERAKGENAIFRGIKCHSIKPSPIICNLTPPSFPQPQQNSTSSPSSPSPFPTPTHTGPHKPSSPNTLPLPFISVPLVRIPRRHLLRQPIPIKPIPLPPLLLLLPISLRSHTPLPSRVIHIADSRLANRFSWTRAPGKGTVCIG